MDIPALSIALNQVNFRQDVGITLMKNMMNQSESKAMTMIQMLHDAGKQMQQASQPHLGSNIDVKL
ncbi:YjfB family protein [Salirhabdus sp. Marseille-P4669]|uniref:YjfB family protein n=1 Tax=Salirhabdus sp. Marseille-P4669 TaxID=2042310 RepID=UPI000C7D0E9B|nr:YjfB family protein [Salirhabdus sp. Marseille-P4669]